MVYKYANLISSAGLGQRPPPQRNSPEGSLIEDLRILFSHTSTVRLKKMGHVLQKCRFTYEFLLYYSYWARAPPASAYQYGPVMSWIRLQVVVIKEFVQSRSVTGQTQNVTAICTVAGSERYCFSASIAEFSFQWQGSTQPACSELLLSKVSTTTLPAWWASLVVGAVTS